MSDDIRLGKPAPPKKIGTVQVIDVETGEVIAEKPNAMTVMPPDPSLCQECAVDHPHDQPHNQKSLYWQISFHSTHGRWPTWSDAMAHTTPEVQAAWKQKLIEVHKENGLPVPEDLLDPKPKGR